MSKEQELFRKLSFCWKYFEQDGLNAATIDEFIDILADPVLVVGSGQGLVSKHLNKKYSEVHSVDKLPEMAKYAKIRRNIDTEIVDFMTMPITRKFSSIIINTGVITPSLIKKKSNQLGNSISSRLKPKGVAILAFFKRTSFDDFVEDVGLNTSKKLIIEIATEIYQGNSIIDVLSKNTKCGNTTKYYKLRYGKELMEYEQQFRDVLRCFNKTFPGEDIMKFIADSLLYVSYGLDYLQQAKLVGSIVAAGLTVNRVDERGTKIIITVSRESLS